MPYHRLVHAIATASLLAAAFYGYSAAYFGLLSQRETALLDPARIAALAASLCFHSTVNALLVHPDLVRWQTTTLQLSTLSATTSILAYTDFAYRLSRRPLRFRGWLLAWAAVGGVGVLLGLMVEARPPGVRPFLVLVDVPALHNVSLSAFGTLHLLVGLVSLFASLRSLLKARHVRQARIFLVPMLLVCASGAHDILLRFGFLRSIYISEYVAILTVGTMIYALIERLSAQRVTLHRTTDELVESRVALRKTHDRMIRAEEQASIGELAAVLAHEVRNPLAVIKNAVASLRRGRLQIEDRKTLLDILDEEGDRLQRLVRDLLAYARPAHPRQVTVSADFLLEQTAEHLRSKGTHEIVVQAMDAPMTIFGDAELLLTALRHVADNALQAAPRGSPIVLSCDPAKLGHRLAIAFGIRDQGPGMSSALEEKAKTPFFTTKASGIGLGLAIVDRIAQGHFGRLEIETQEGVGTLVRIVLPIERHSQQPAPPSEGELPLTQIATIGDG